MYKSTFQYIYIPFLNSYIAWVLYFGLIIVFTMELFYQINMVLLEESPLHSSTYLLFMNPDIKFY